MNCFNENFALALYLGTWRRRPACSKRTIT